MRRSIDTWLDRFAYNHPRFGIPHLINYILIGNVVIYLLDIYSVCRGRLPPCGFFFFFFTEKPKLPILRPSAKYSPCA